MLEPLGHNALTGLLYRALAGNADPDRAAITRRRIEQLQMQRTELLKERSVLLTDEQTAAARLKNARRSAEDASLDIRIFRENNPEPPAAKRGLLGRRISPERRQWEEKLNSLEGIAGEEMTQEAEYARIHEQISARLQAITERQDEVDEEYAGQLDELRGQLAAWVLESCAGGQSGDARERLAEFRSLLRGELSVAVLLSLCDMISKGPEAALQSLPDLAGIWDQHPDPLRQVLDSFYRLLRDGRLQRREAGMLQQEQFSQVGHWRLYRLVRILGGWPAPEGEESDGFSRTLWAMEQTLLTQDPPADWQPQPAEGMAAWSSGADAVCRIACCLALWQRGETALLPRAAGMDLDLLAAPARPVDQWPMLLETLSASRLPGWPAELATKTWSELACLVLLAAHEHAEPGLYEQWLAESFNWPKSPLFWWTMARLKGDAGLLRRMRGETAVLVMPEPASL